MNKPLLNRYSLKRSVSSLALMTISNSSSSPIRSRRNVYLFSTVLLSLIFVIVYLLRDPRIPDDRRWHIPTEASFEENQVIGLFTENPSLRKKSSGIKQQKYQTVPTCMTTEPLRRYVLVFDAGSTGSRVHVYQFDRKNCVYNVTNEVFEQLKPGLSAYADEPKLAGKSIQTLIDRVKWSIPVDEWKDTPATLRATAGLRLLPGAKSDALLHEVGEVLKSSGLKLCLMCISLMDGKDEGVLSWITINYLADNLGSSVKSTATTLDLGGGSTQITLVPDSTDLLLTPDDLLLDVDLLKQSFKLYVKSYLGLGLMSAREQILQLNTSGPTSVTPCVPQGSYFEWQNRNVEYRVRSSAKSVDRFKDCYLFARKVIHKSEIDRPNDLAALPTYALSYFFDRAADANLIDRTKGGDLSVQDFLTAAIHQCSELQIKKNEEFLCMDLTYIFSLLRDGYGYSLKSQLKLRKKIRGFETGWSLGAGFQTLQNL